MSEYWKSTPKYWCKHCSTYVRDTKLEKQNHEATAKHQGNLKRFLRDLHRNNDKEERDKQRAKDEVARLNGAPSGSSYSRHGGLQANQGQMHVGRSPAPKALATAADQKRQLSELAAMRIAIPEEFRRDLALASEWETVAPPPQGNRGTEHHSLGVRKRRDSDDEDEQGAVNEGQPSKRRTWGSSFKTYPNGTGEDEDLELLLKSKTRVFSTKIEELHPYDESGAAGIDTKVEEASDATAEVKQESEDSDEGVAVKEDPALDEKPAKISFHEIKSGTATGVVKLEQAESDEPIRFKKRKSKPNISMKK